MRLRSTGRLNDSTHGSETLLHQPILPRPKVFGSSTPAILLSSFSGSLTCVRRSDGARPIPSKLVSCEVSKVTGTDLDSVVAASFLLASCVVVPSEEDVLVSEVGFELVKAERFHGLSMHSVKRPENQG